jgi:CRISPR-associated protein Cas1
VQWSGRNYDVKDWEKGDIANQCLSAATSCLYGITEAAVLAAGYAPAVGFIHTGKPLSFVYDIADIFKFESVVPIAFRIAGKKLHNPDREVRLACRDIFRSNRVLEKIIPTIEEVLAAGEIKPPEMPAESVAPAIPNPDNLGDEGHRTK